MYVNFWLYVTNVSFPSSNSRLSHIEREFIHWNSKMRITYGVPTRISDLSVKSPVVHDILYLHNERKPLCPFLFVVYKWVTNIIHIFSRVTTFGDSSSYSFFVIVNFSALHESSLFKEGRGMLLSFLLCIFTVNILWKRASGVHSRFVYPTMSAFRV